MWRSRSSTKSRRSGASVSATGWKFFTAKSIAARAASLEALEQIAAIEPRRLFQIVQILRASQLLKALNIARHHQPAYVVVT
jgi:hypothetical protein